MKKEPPHMAQIWVRFHAELNDFLPPQRRGERLGVPFPGRASIKDTLESLGVPHPEIALILVQGAPVDFAYLVQEDDDIEAYPHSLARTLPYPPRLPSPEPRFVLDAHLGRLAERLRLLGFDTLYRNDYDDPELAQIAGTERRILLSRDLGLLKRAAVIYGYFVRATDPEQQVIEIARRFDLFNAIQPFHRCVRCNGMLESVAKAEIEDRLPPQVRAEHAEFRQCDSCGQLYWPGSHYARIQSYIAELVRQAAPEGTSNA
jgi:uncharacterized protein